MGTHGPGRRCRAVGRRGARGCIRRRGGQGPDDAAEGWVLEGGRGQGLEGQTLRVCRDRLRARNRPRRDELRHGPLLHGADAELDQVRDCRHGRHGIPTADLAGRVRTDGGAGGGSEHL